VDAVRIECLGCGEARVVDAGRAEAQAVDTYPHPHRLDPGECPRCGYLGWAPSTALTEPMRRRIRERPVDRRAAIYAV
jgi:hypothetical protein